MQTTLSFQLTRKSNGTEDNTTTGHNNTITTTVYLRQTSVQTNTNGTKTKTSLQTTPASQVSRDSNASYVNTTVSSDQEQSTFSPHVTGRIDNTTKQSNSTNVSDLYTNTTGLPMPGQVTLLQGHH